MAVEGLLTPNGAPRWHTRPDILQPADLPLAVLAAEAESRVHASPPQNQAALVLLTMQYTQPEKYKTFDSDENDSSDDCWSCDCLREDSEQAIFETDKEENTRGYDDIYVSVAESDEDNEAANVLLSFASVDEISLEKKQSIEKGKGKAKQVRFKDEGDRSDDDETIIADTDVISEFEPTMDLDKVRPKSAAAIRLGAGLAAYLELNGDIEIGSGTNGQATGSSNTPLKEPPTTKYHSPSSIAKAAAIKKVSKQTPDATTIAGPSSLVPDDARFPASGSAPTKEERPDPLIDTLRIRHPYMQFMKEEEVKKARAQAQQKAQGEVKSCMRVTQEQEFQNTVAQGKRHAEAPEEMSAKRPRRTARQSMKAKEMNGS